MRSKQFFLCYPNKNASCSCCHTFSYHHYYYFEIPCFPIIRIKQSIINLYKKIVIYIILIIVLKLNCKIKIE